MSEFPAMVFPDPSRFDAILFDCDGTLVDTMPLFYYAWRDSLERCGAKVDFRWDYFCDRGGQRTEVTLNEICASSGERIDEEPLLRHQRDFIAAHIGDVVAIEPVVQFAEHCRKIAKPLAVASGGYREFVHRSLEGTKLKAYFPVIVTCEDVKHTKPAPDLFLLAAEKLGVMPRHCLVLEDSPLGIQAASTAGMASWLVPAIHRSGALPEVKIL
ncbi:MAG: HAD family phosphatase [Puniceicoccales bacterium]|jgi:HAD superfamily hydrolase (TIGR01509 family)|nr:HAD family phosphatase [Puniceicoccales bacterium]